VSDVSLPCGVLACPHCSLPLVLTSRDATCATGHAFDRAKGGHLHLLVGGRIASRSVAGDTADSLVSRRRFLDSGAYAPIAAALAECVGHVDGALLDVGCGEGYYTGHLDAAERYGLDVSKHAVRMAARRLPDATFVVGSAYRLPVLDRSLAMVTSVFAPHPLDEFHRVLRPTGRWVTVTPGPQHLDEMRPMFTGEAATKAEARRRERRQPPAGAQDARRLTFALDMTLETASDLLTMTPIRWQAGAVAPRSVTVDVWLSWGTPTGA
jgi:23S rRNA (guanine745-N1)-methyltransferase